MPVTAPAGRTAIPLWPLALITFSGTSAMHMFVPALTVAGADLHASASSVQLTITVYILGLALGQLVYGPLADSFGRRPVLLAGLLLFTAGGLASAVAPNIQVLLVARVVQSLGGCAGFLLPRTILRDTATSSEAVRRLALLSLLTAVGPGLSPILGGFMAGSFGWRAIFVLLSGLGLLNLAVTWKLLPETGAPTGHISAASVRADYGSLLGSARFLGYAIGGGCATTSMYAFIAAAPFIYVNQLHRPPHEVGLVLGGLMVGASTGSVLASQLSHRIGIHRMMVGAHAISLLSGLCFLMLVLLNGPHAWVIAGLMFLFALGTGACSPAVTVSAMNVIPPAAGSAAGLYGCTQMAVGGLCTLLVTLHHDAALATGCVLLGACVLGQSAFWLARRAERTPNANAT